MSQPARIRNGAKPPRKPRVRGVDVLGTSELAKQISQFCKEFGREQFLRFQEAASNVPGKGKIKVPASALSRGAGYEQKLMAGLGWYWEPLLHDLAFFEQMRDSVPLLAGAYQKFTDVIMDGFAIQHEDPEVVKRFEDALLWSDVDFDEVVREAALSILTLSNCYRLPIYEGSSQGLALKTLKPVRPNAIRRLRDENLVTEGYVQLLHRPSEFIFGGTPQTPTIWLSDEVLAGIAFTKDWYAYGVPPLASLPFIVKMKLQMERDLAELLHQHVPRIDVTYTPEEQMSQEQVDDAITDVRTQVSGLQPTDNLVHTPDTVFEFKGPQGKGLDFTGGTTHVESQFYAVLPLGPYLLGREFNINPIMAQQIWQLSNVLAKRIRIRVYVMFRPMLEKLAQSWGVDVPTFRFNDFDVETQETQARTDEYHIQNASAMRDAGFINQDEAAQHATRNRPGGPVKKAAADGPLPPPVDPNKQPPGATGATGKVRNADKGPKAPNRSAPTPDKRTRGKRHEATKPFDDIFAGAEAAFDIAYDEEE